MKVDRDQTSCGRRDADSYSQSHYHSDLNSIFTVCFSPEGSTHQRRQTNNTRVLALSHANQQSSTFVFPLNSPFGHRNDIGYWLYFLHILLLLEILRSMTSFLQCWAFSAGYHSDIVCSLRRGCTCLPLLLEFSELEGANFIDFHLLFFSLPCTPQSPDSKTFLVSECIDRQSVSTWHVNVQSSLGLVKILGVCVYFSLAELIYLTAVWEIMADLTAVQSICTQE